MRAPPARACSADADERPVARPPANPARPRATFAARRVAAPRSAARTRSRARAGRPARRRAAQLAADHRERPAAEADVVDEQARALRPRAGDRELPAHVGDLLLGVGHLALRRVVAHPLEHGRVGQPRRSASRRARSGTSSPLRRDGTAVTHATGAPQLRTASAAASTSSSAKRPSPGPPTSGSQPPSPSRASARPSSTRTPSGIFFIAPCGSGAIFLASRTSGRERRCSAASRTSTSSSGPS